MTEEALSSPAGPPEYRVAPRRYWPVATLAILAVNGLLFVLETLAGGSKNPGVLLDFGASYGPYLRRGEYWRLVMPMFLHIGWLHLLVNSYALYILGPILEHVYGYGRYAAIYVATGIGSALLSMTISNNIAAGASGAIFGVAGAMLVTGYLHRDVIPLRWGRAFGRGMIPFIVVNLAFGFSVRGIDNWGHLGGLASGVLLALAIAPPGHNLLPGEIAEPPSQAIVALPLAVVLLAMAATVDHYRTSQAVSRLLAEGARFEAAQQYDRALQSFQEAARRAPRDERPHQQLGALYLAQRKYDQAIEEFEAAGRLSPGDPQSRLGLGMAYRLKGDLTKAQQIFEAVLGKNPQTAEGQRLLADLYADQKLYGDAIAHYREALRLEPNMAEAHNNLAWLYATSEDLKFRDPQAALAHAQRAVDLTQWKEAGFIDTLAEAQFAKGNYRDAVVIQNKALALEPDNREFQEHMSRYRKAAGI
ncbi:MAG: rhomboid family intramembrane serine protease [Terriglobia bacterium]|jgi:rhomboid protease GluP